MYSPWGAAIGGTDESGNCCCKVLSFDACGNSTEAGRSVQNRGRNCDDICVCFADVTRSLSQPAPDSSLCCEGALTTMGGNSSEAILRSIEDLSVFGLVNFGARWSDPFEALRRPNVADFLISKENVLNAV